MYERGNEESGARTSMSEVSVFWHLTSARQRNNVVSVPHPRRALFYLSPCSSVEQSPQGLCPALVAVARSLWLCCTSMHALAMTSQGEAGRIVSPVARGVHSCLGWCHASCTKRESVSLISWVPHTKELQFMPSLPW